MSVTLVDQALERIQHRTAKLVVVGQGYVGLPVAMRGAWGPHMRLLGRHLATTALEPWVDRALSWNNLPSFTQLQDNGGAIDHGELDRANWRLSTADGRIQKR